MPKREEKTIKKGDYVAHVSVRSVPGYLRHGWTLVDDGSSEPEPQQAAETPEQPIKKTTSRKAE